MHTLCLKCRSLVSPKLHGSPKEPLLSVRLVLCGATRGGGGGGGTGSASGGGRGNWLINGLSSLRGHRRASSGERTRDSGSSSSSSSSHRLSTYDNVASCSSSASGGGAEPEGAGPEGVGQEGGASGTSSPWSTSSCEILVTDSGGKNAVALETQEQPHGAPLSQSADETPEEPEDASVAMEICVSSTNCSSSNGNAPVVVVVTAEDSDGTLVVGLKEELRKQKTTYEDRIQR